MLHVNVASQVPAYWALCVRRVVFVRAHISLLSLCNLLPYKLQHFVIKKLLFIQIGGWGGGGVDSVQWHSGVVKQITPQTIRRGFGVLFWSAIMGFFKKAFLTAFLFFKQRLCCCSVGDALFTSCGPRNRRAHGYMPASVQPWEMLC